MKHVHALLLVSALLSGCSMVPDYLRPDISIPASWRGEQPAQTPETTPDAQWWDRFGSAGLQQSVAGALAGNNDLGAALHRVEQARASATIAGAPLFPQADASGSIGYDRVRPSRGRTESAASYRVGPELSYEIDLWGRNRASADAAKAAAQATAYDYDASALIISTDTAQAYIRMLTLGERLRVASDNLINARSLLSITQARFDAGALSALELAQQQNTVAGNEASLLALARDRDAALTALAVLLGRTPQDFTVQEEKVAALNPPALAPFQPAELLARRPDIAAVEAALVSANFDIGAARTAFYPSLGIGADGALAASPLSAPASLAYGIAATAAAPLFTGGALEGALERANARQKELAEQYRSTVLTAFKEVQDALMGVQAAEGRLKHFQVAAQAARTAHELARQRFDAGAIDFQALLDTQQNALQSEDALVQAQEERLNAAITLYRALGGGWKEPVPQG